MLMETTSELISSANNAVEQGDWETACEKMAQAAVMEPENVGIQNGFATCLLQTGKAADAVKVFRNMAFQTPDSAEAQNNLGVALAINGDRDGAEAAYKTALTIDDNYTHAWKNLAQLYIQGENNLTEGVQILAALVQADPKDNEALSLLAACYEIAGDYSSAEILLCRALENRPDDPSIRTQLERIQKNRPDPTRIARPEHAKKLAALKGLLKPTSTKETTENQPENTVAIYERLPETAIAFYATPDLTGIDQFQIWAKTLARKGCQTRVSSEFNPSDLETYEYFVFSNPIISPVLINAVTACLHTGKKYAVDLDMDFHHMPEDHPAYAHFGPGNPQALLALEIILKDAVWVSVPSRVMAERYQPFTKKIELVLPVIDLENPMWTKPRPNHETFNVGWIGTAADRADLFTIKDELTRFVMDHSDSLLMVAGDFGAYDIFEGVPETRRMYLPNSSLEETIFNLGQFDVLVVPHRNNAYNLSRSSLLLQAAKNKGIPWIASPIPAFKETVNEGKFATNSQEWITALTEVIVERYADRHRTLQ